MPRVALTRMRRTCSQLNNLAGKHEKFWDKTMNPKLELKLQLSTKFSDSYFSYEVELFDKKFGTEYEEKATGVLLKTILLHIFRTEPFAMNMITGSLRRMHTSCHKLVVSSNLKAEDIVKITDHIENIDHAFIVRHTSRTPQRKVKSFLEALAESKHRSKMEVFLENERVKRSYYKGGLIDDIITSTDLGSISTLVVNASISKWNPFRSTQSLLSSFSPFNLAKTPKFYTLLSDGFLSSEMQKAIHCYFLDTLDDVFTCFTRFHSIENVDIRLRKEFATAHEERQRSILVDIYTQHILNNE